MLTSLRHAALLLALTSSLALGGDVRAEEGELALSLGAGAWLGSMTVDEAEVFSVAPTGVVAIRYGLDDFWQIGGSLSSGVALSGDHDPGFLGMAHAEVYYFLDVVTWVLWGVGGVGVVARDAHPDVLAGEASAPVFDASAVVGVGLDYRPAREWSVGAAFRYQLVLTDLDRTAPTAHVALMYTLYFQ
ncbi:MAG: hypothetical protein EP329_02515 [Deltaproteobacteria bacterium]|nr:MAG: hypothetical protein EP329_02515 [Deltaproteobacteria bacterium]